MFEMRKSYFNLLIKPEQIPNRDDVKNVLTTQKATFTWEINNLHKNCLIQSISPDFSLPSKSHNNYQNIKFNLKVSFKTSASFYNNQKQDVLIWLCMKNPNTHDISRKLSVYYRLSFLNAYGQKCLSKDGKAVFANSNRGTIEEPIEGWEYRISHEYLRENGLLVENRDNHNNNKRGPAKILCELLIVDDSNDTLETTTFEQKWQDQKLQPTLVCKNPIPIPSTKSNEALDDYQTLLESGTLSDVVLVVGKKEFQVHKAILAARSPVFAAMFSNDLEEKLTNRVGIPDLDVEVCELLLPYIYTGKIPSMEEYALELFFVSDKYQLDHLKSICEQNLIKTISIQTVAHTLLLADMHSAVYLKRKCVKYITRNSEQIMATKGWVEMTKARPELLMELYKDISAKANSLLKQTG